MENLLLYISCVFAGFATFFKYTNQEKYYKYFKTLPIFFLIIYVLIIPFPKSYYANIILLALIFSVIGDIFLLSKVKFNQGLFSFLIAHAFYSYAFINDTDGYNYLLFLPVLMFSFFIFFSISSFLKRYKIPVALYIFIISIMLWAAFNKFIINETGFSLFSFLGAILFVISDSLLAWNKFRKKLKYGPMLVSLTYYSAQILFVISIGVII